MNDSADTSKAKSARNQAAAGQTASAVGQHSMASARNARLAADAIRASHAKQVAGTTSAGEFVAERAVQIRDAMGKAAAEGKRSGAFEAVKGHFIEGMTIENYNAAGKWAGKKMVGRKSPVNAAYDASRYVARDGSTKFAGGVQIKSSAHGVEKAIRQVEKVKPGSATRATVMVSEDEVAKATTKAAGRIRVRGNGVTRQHATNRADQGINSLADNGMKATSQVRALGKAGVIGAVAGVAVGGLSEARALKRGDVSGRHFAEDRAIDAAEGATSAVTGTLAASAASATATAALGTAAGASVAATAGAAGTAVLGTVGGMGAGGAAAAAALGTITAPVAIPVAVGVVGSVAVGVSVSKVGKKVRKKVAESREAESPGNAEEQSDAEPSVSTRPSRQRRSRGEQHRNDRAIEARRPSMER